MRKKQKKLLMLLFICLPLACCLLIGLHLDIHKTKSIRERRALQSLPRNMLLHAPQLEKYISDHLPFRDKLIQFYFQSKLGVDFGNNRNIIGTGNFTFHPFKGSMALNGIKVYQNDLLFDSAQIEAMKQNMQKIADFATKNHIKVYFIIPPSPARIYAHWMPNHILRKNQISVAEQVEQALKNMVSVVPLDKELHQRALAAKYPLVFKTDNHWSEDGAYEAYQILMAEISKDFKNVVALQREAYNIEYTPMVWHLYDSKDSLIKGAAYMDGLDYGNVLYRHYIFKNQADLEETNLYEYKTAHYNNAPNLRAYVISDSSGCYLWPFLKPTFRDVSFYRYNIGDERDWIVRWQSVQQKFMKEKPDILIIIVTDQLLPILYKQNKQHNP